MSSHLSSNKMVSCLIYETYLIDKLISNNKFVSAFQSEAIKSILCMQKNA